jgi:tRNA-splicing ligase RtcB
MDLVRIDDHTWEIPKQGGMRVPGIVYASSKLLASVRADKTLEQARNVACLPGIVKASYVMPDGHQGYGFPIGGVAAFDPDEGVISPGGVGYDINCGVRLLRTDLQAADVAKRLTELVDQLFRDVPCGVGVGGDFIFADKDMRRLLAEGAGALVDRGLASAADLEATESAGCLAGADPDAVSDQALKRGRDQCGTLGSGNHFVEVQRVEEVYDDQAAKALGLEAGLVTAMIHSGSRGLGHQVCQDAIRDLRKAPQKYGFTLPDGQLVCAPVKSDEGQRYLGAMRAAANFAWANRQLLAAQIRKTLARFFGESEAALGIRQVYDVAHNIAKIETHMVAGQARKLCLHRKGATRAFGPGHPELPERYRRLGQPVLIPGDMGRYSYVLVGTEKALTETFGSTCHGAGREMSRHQALKVAKGRSIIQELAAKGIVVRGAGRATIDEEISEAYKDVADVVDVVHGAGIAKKVAKLKPLGVIKG